MPKNMNPLKKYWLIGGVLVLLVALLLLIALFAGFLPLDKDGYRYQYVGGHIIKIKTFVPPPGTQLMSERVGDTIVNYYGTTTEQQY